VKKKTTAVLRAFSLSDPHDEAFFFQLFFEGEPVSGV
jgi:hypothetical protein